MKGLLYFIVIIVANSIGAVSGMGGGVIIKPVLDVIAADSVAAVSFYSTVAVFVMALVSTVRQAQSGMKLDAGKILCLAAGSAGGGYLGGLAFDSLLSMTGASAAQLTQIGLTVLLLIFSLLASRNCFPSYRLQGGKYYLICGVLLGFLSSFLGIGGGPFNVPLFMIAFSIPIKEATVYSIATIFFSQLSKILSLVFVLHFRQFDEAVLSYIIAAAILGGLIGAYLSRILSSDRVALIFQLVVIAVLLLNLYNAWQLIF